MDITSYDSYDLVRLFQLLLLLVLVILFRWVLKRPIHRLFDWKYFRSKKSRK